MILASIVILVIGCNGLSIVSKKIEPWKKYLCSALKLIFKHKNGAMQSSKYYYYGIMLFTFFLSLPSKCELSMTWCLASTQYTRLVV